MKHVSIIFFSLVVSFSGLSLLAPQAANAQLNNVLDTVTSQAVAFVKTAPNGQSRSILYIKRNGVPVDAYAIDSIFNAIAGISGFSIDSIRHLAVIGMTPDGSHLVLGGQIFYFDPFTNSPASFAGIFRLPWPLTAASIHADPPFVGNTLTWFLQAAPDLGNFHPSGILSPDGKRWYAAMRTSSPGSQPMNFYSGLVDGSAPVDSVLITSDIAGSTSAPEAAWIESNLALDITTTPPTMLVAEVDRIESIGNQAQRYLLMHWQPPQAIQAQDISDEIKGQSGAPQVGLDSCFGVTVAALQDRQDAEVGLQYLNGSSDTNHTIEFYSARYNVSGTPTLSFTGTTIPALPDKTFTFFAGSNTTQYTDDLAAFHEHAQSGDVMLTNDGQTALFITHEHPENLADTNHSPRDIKSAIFSYSFGSGQATMLYDDSNAQELQPVFVTAKDTIPHTAGITAAATITFPPLDTGSTETQTLTITDTSNWNGTNIDSIKITGDNEFSVIWPSFPHPIQHGDTAHINLQFAPVGSAGLRTGTLTIYSPLSADNILMVNLKGTATVKAGGGGSVKEDPSMSSLLTIEPNPFSSVARVELTAQDAGPMGIIVHDALGHVVYTSPVRHTAAGSTETFNFDAKSLSLPNGVYYVTALFGDRQVTKQIVLTR